jgi:hypothetical protein
MDLRPHPDTGGTLEPGPLMPGSFGLAISPQDLQCWSSRAAGLRPWPPWDPSVPSRKPRCPADQADMRRGPMSGYPVPSRRPLLVCCAGSGQTVFGLFERLNWDDAKQQIDLELYLKGPRFASVAQGVPSQCSTALCPEHRLPLFDHTFLIYAIDIRNI